MVHGCGAARSNHLRPSRPQARHPAPANGSVWDTARSQGRVPAAATPRVHAVRPYRPRRGIFGLTIVLKPTFPPRGREISHAKSGLGGLRLLRLPCDEDGADLVDIQRAEAARRLLE